VRGPSARALLILRCNRYIVLGTTGEHGPWSCALAGVPFYPRHIYFVSARTSRHAKNVLVDPRVSGVIFNSASEGVDAASIQFSGRCAPSTDDPHLVTAVLYRAARLAGTDPPSARDAASVLGGTDAAVFCVDVERAYVLDQKAWEDRGVNARIKFDFGTVVAAYDAWFSRAYERRASGV
jgi:Pyridoxamine 5'-phosphate oxidase